MHDVHDLELALLGLLDRFLAGYHDEREAAKKSVGSWRREVGCAGTQRRQTYACLAGKPAVCRSHERSALFMPGQDEFNLLGCPEGLQKVQVFFPRYSKNILYTLILECLNEQV